jgi:hypothetical protein
MLEPVVRRTTEFYADTPTACNLPQLGSCPSLKGLNTGCFVGEPFGNRYVRIHVLPQRGIADRVSPIH